MPEPVRGAAGSSGGRGPSPRPTILDSRRGRA